MQTVGQQHQHVIPQKRFFSLGRKMVTIVDPHIKRDSDYKIFKTAEDKGYYVKKPNGEDYDG